MMSLAVPEPDEFAPFYAGYVARVTHLASAIDELTLQRHRMLQVFASVGEEQSRYRYAAGKWSIKTLVGHLSDAERIFAYRLLRIGRGDETPLAGWDENDYAGTADSDSRAFRDLVDEWAIVRDGTSTLAAGLPADAWTRRGTANDTTVSARALLYIILGHVEHHRAVLEERYGVRGQ